MNITIPVIRNILPEQLARDILSVQPMTEDHGQIFKMRIAVDPAPSQEGDRRHAFGRGWQVFYGGEWIAEQTWLKINTAGL